MAAQIISSSVEPLLLSASPVAGNGGQRGRPSGFFRPSPVIHLGQEPASHTLSNDFYIQDLLTIEHQEGLTDVQALLHQCQKTNRETMTTVNHLKLLCIDHYFKDEIESTVDACVNLIHSDDLFDATLSFRLMREVGYDASAAWEHFSLQDNTLLHFDLRKNTLLDVVDDVLRKFTNGKGDFNFVHSKDIRGLLSLQDISHLYIGEVSLYKAKKFSSKHLKSAIKYLEPNLARYVRQSLDHPYHVSLMQYKARHHLSYLQSLPTRNIAMEKLALAEFHLNKLLHQKEMQEIKRWWMELRLAQEIPVALDQVLKWYMWPMTCIQGQSFSRYRTELTKIISFIYIVDDIFDLVGTQEELSLFTEAIKLWDIAAADSLPSYMRSCYKALYTVTNGIADIAQKEHGLNPIDYLKKAWAMLFDGFMVEAKWLSTNQVPAPEDYLRNGVVTSGVPLLFVHLFFMLGHDVAKDATNLIDHIPPVISCPAKILRLWDDMGSAKDEAQEGFDGSYKKFYLKENPQCDPADAEEHMFSLIASAWEELNRECFSRWSFPPSFIQASLNFARMVSVVYGYDNEQRLPVLEDYIRMLLF